jgi:glyceraldehyde-3-phosphate dehydrogenase (NADP+)
MDIPRALSAVEHPFLVGGEWIGRGTLTGLRSPWRDRPIARYWKGSADDLEAAIAAAASAAPVVAEVPAHRRSQVLDEVAAGLRDRREEIATRLMLEAGKPIRLARQEVDRAYQTFRCAAAEAGRIGGEWLAIDADPAGVNKVGIVRRFPIGVIGAITPFNFPLNLVAHKVAPAIAAGNAMVLKPASQTPLCALAIGELVHRAGWPAGGLNVVPCAGDTAFAMAAERRLAMLSFTGSAEIGWRLESAATRKRVVLELGGNAAVIVNHDADIDRAAERCAAGGFQYAGQSCISVQRIFVHRDRYDRFRKALIERVAALRVGDPADEEVEVGPVITAADAQRIVGWVREAAAAGAVVLTGGGHDGALVEPTILEKVDPAMAVSCREVFGPVVVLRPFGEFRDAVRMVNDSDFGLQAGVFTRDIGAIEYAHRGIEVGGLMINEVPTFRVDHMPYGGVKDSGNGREGPRYAIEEMTEPRLLVLHGLDPL